MAFALRDCIEVAKANGLQISATRICGGGAKSDIWKKVIANIFGVPVYTLNVEEGPAYGAVILAMVGSKEYMSIDKAVESLVTTNNAIIPNESLIKKYETRYRYFQKLYPSLRDVFKQYRPR